jgi:hypothetical protein
MVPQSLKSSRFSKASREIDASRVQEVVQKQTGWWCCWGDSTVSTRFG